MKLLQHQKHFGRFGDVFHNLTTIALDDLGEANGLVKSALGDDSFLKESYKSCMDILRANKGRRGVLPAKPSVGWFRENLIEALQQIESGDAKVNLEAAILAEKMVEQAKEIEPSLTLEKAYTPSEEGEIFDAGKIASSDPMAFFAQNRTDRPKSGRGDGAFRILINTDVSWWGDPTTQCAALMAVVLLLQRQAPVEIWIQQGWLGSTPTDGVTLFKIFSGGVIQPQNIFFWIGSEHKDSPYSFIVNRMLQRQQSRVSTSPELPCDLYIYGQFMPRIDDVEQWNNWIAQTAKQMLFEEELPENWSGYLSTLPPKQ